jgi:hypothetical protein
MAAKNMNPTAIYSKSGKGVQEASGKTSLLQRGDRAVLAAIDGRATLADVAQKVGKPYDAAFQKIIEQLDKDGFIRQLSAGAPGAAGAKPAAAAPVSRPGPKPAAKAPEKSLGDLDFSSLGGSKPPSRAAPTPSPSPMEQTTVLAKAREEAEAKAAAERERLKKEVKVKELSEMQAQMRAEAEDKIKEQAAARAKAEAEANARAAEAKEKAAQEAAARALAEAKAKAEAEARARVEAEAKAKLEAERKAREELERKLEAERKAREEAERKAKAEAERRAKEEAERARREAEENARREAEVLRKAREEAERKAKEEAEAKARLEAERKREEARRQQEEERKQRAAEDAAQREAAAAAAAAAAAMANVAAAPGPGDGVTKKGKKKDNFADTLLADLESFTSDGEEEQKAREEADRQSKAEADRRRAEVDRKAQEEAERRREAEEEEQRLAEEARRAQEEEERRAREEERRKREAEEIRRKAEAATVAAMAAEGKKHEPKEDDIPVTDDDLDMTEVESEEAQVAEAKAKEKEEKERAAKKEKKKKKEEAAYTPPRPRRPIKWGKPVATTLALILIIGVGAAHIVPLDAADYERVSSAALGRTVKIGSANLWLFSGLPQVRFSDVRIGEARISRVVASGWPGGLFGDKKEFTNVLIEGLSLPQQAIGGALFARVRADNLSVSSVTIRNLQLPGPATLPKDLFAAATFDTRGTLRSAKVEGPDGLVAKLTPKQDGSIDFDVLAGGFTLPIAPQVTLSKFAMHGVATPRGMTINDWGGALFQGGISGKANVRWSGSWSVDGVVTVRNINAAVFAPALLSSGNADGTAKFSMSAADPAGLVAGSRLDGTFTVSQGTLGSFDLARYIQSGGKQAAGTTQFVEMNGQATYDRGTVALRNINIGAGRLNAGASADIANNGALSGRIVADMKVSDDTRRATLLIGGTVKEPQVRN